MSTFFRFHLPLSILALSAGLYSAGLERPQLDSHAWANSIADRSAALRFIVVGDTQDDGTTGGGINDNMWPAMAADINALNPAFALFPGDLVSGSSSMSTMIGQWNDWDTATSALACPRYMTPGNHDMYSGSGTVTSWGTKFPWLPTANSPVGEEGCSYWFDVGTTRIIAIASDLESGGVAPNQAWLDGVLAQSGHMENIFVFSHRPVMFSASEPCGNTGDDFWQSLVQNDVTGYFSGHWHRYQPGKLGNGGDTWETVIGTGGGWLGFDPIRPYQQIPGFLLVEVDGLDVTGSFYTDADGDGEYDDIVDQYTMRSSTPSPTGLVAEYTFDHGDARDTAWAPLGKKVHGELNGMASVGNGISGAYGLHLDGLDSYVEAGALGDYNMATNGDLTLSAFGKFHALGTGTWDNPLLTYGTGDYFSEDEESNFSFWLSLRSDGTMFGFWEYEDGNNVSLSSTVPAQVAAGEVHHYAMTRDAFAMEVRFFVDGVLLGAPVPFTELPTGGARGMLYLGSDTPKWMGSEVEWNGILDDIRIHNKVLTLGEIIQLATPRPGLLVQNLVAGGQTTLLFERCSPHGIVMAAYSLVGGGPFHTPYGVASLSLPYRLLPPILMTPSGTGSLNLPVPPTAGGLPVWIQGVDLASSMLTNPLALVVG
ncbi:MAG: metallophosphoesterase [Planctomycetes bacterium]|nr:metallophosphoesterase [Planctomycetota bacterium]